MEKELSGLSYSRQKHVIMEIQEATSTADQCDICKAIMKLKKKQKPTLSGTFFAMNVSCMDNPL